MKTTEILKRNELLLTEIDIVGAGLPSPAIELFKSTAWMLEIAKRNALGAVPLEEVDKCIDRIDLPKEMVILAVTHYFDVLRQVLLGTEMYEWVSRCNETRDYIISKLQSA